MNLDFKRFFKSGIAIFLSSAFASSSVLAAVDPKSNEKCKISSINSEIKSENNNSQENQSDIAYKTLDRVISENSHLPKIDEAYPLNEVDDLIFSLIVYLPFLKTMSKVSECKEQLTLKEYSEQVSKICEGDDNTYVDDQDVHTSKIYQRKSNRFFNSRLELLKNTSKCDRYKNIKIGDYKVVFNPIVIKPMYCQFAAVTFTLEDGTKIVTYRGTDSTKAGWEENFQTYWGNEARVQKLAREYLSDVADFYPSQDLYIAGHSKGGSLAIYAYLKNLKKGSFLGRVRNVHDFDGPGVKQEIIEDDKKSDEYKKVYQDNAKEIIDKITVYVPQTSIIASIMDNDEFPHYIVTSDARNLYQHDALTWETNPNFSESDVIRFRPATRTSASIIFKEAWKETEKNMDKSKFARVVSRLFEFIYNYDVDDPDLNVKRTYHNYVSHNSVFRVFMLFFSPRKFFKLTDKENNEFAEVFQIMIRAILHSIWKHRDELKLSKMSLKQIGKLQNAELTKINSLFVALLIWRDYCNYEKTLQKSTSHQ